MKLFWIPLVLGVMALACTGSSTHMQIIDQPVYVCPTATPRATDTPAPTSTPPLMYLTPSGFVTLTALLGCIWDGVACATNTPIPGGLYSTPGYLVPGATSTPRPTTTPYPTPTPFVIRPPEDFHVGDAVYTGGFVSSVNVRLRLLNILTLPASPSPTGTPRSLARWDIEIKNVGASAYEVFPAGQMYISAVMTSTGEVTGVWGASRDAAVESGLLAPLEAVSLSAGETRTFQLAAYIPSGTPSRFAYALDPTTRPTPAAPGVPGTNLLTWDNTVNTTCAGELSEPPVLPTPF